MSYFALDENQILGQTKKPRDHRAERNPHFNHPHSPEAKEAISKSQKARFAYYKNAVNNMMTEERVKQIVQETLKDYLNNNAEGNKNNRGINIPL